VTRGLPPAHGTDRREVAPSNPKVVYGIAENSRRNIVYALTRWRRELRNRVVGHVASFARVLLLRPARRSEDENRVYVLENALMVSKDGGTTFRGWQVSARAIFRRCGSILRTRAAVAGSDGRARVHLGCRREWEHVASIWLGHSIMSPRTIGSRSTRSRRHSGQRHVDRAVAHPESLPES